jgi:hypothetical protein
MGTRILRIMRMNIDFLVALRPLRFDFYGLDPPSAACQTMIYMMAMITIQRNHGHHINHIKS